MTTSLLVYGAGELGLRVAKLWREKFALSEIYCATKTSRNHEKIKDIPAQVLIFEYNQSRKIPIIQKKFSYVVVCIPPGENPGEYIKEVRYAATLLEEEGVLLLVSTTGVYGEKKEAVITEHSPINITSSRVKELVKSENFVLDIGGRVIRFAGLYSKDRGPHRVYLRTETSPRSPNKKINLLHYDDAALLVIKALLNGYSGEVYLGCDGQPLTRQELVDLSFQKKEKILGEQSFEAKRCRFLGETDDDDGAKCDNSWTRKRLDWEPQTLNFGFFISTLQ